MQAKQSKVGIHLPVPVSDKCSAIPRKAGTHLMWLGKTLWMSFLPLPPSFLSSLCWGVGWNIPVVSWSWDQLFLFVSPQPSHWWGGMRSRRRPDFVERCSAIMKTTVCYQHFLAQNQNLAPYLQLWRKFALSQPKPAQKEKGTLKIISITIN